MSILPESQAFIAPYKEGVINPGKPMVIRRQTPTPVVNPEPTPAPVAAPVAAPVLVPVVTPTPTPTIKVTAPTVQPLPAAKSITEPAAQTTSPTRRIRR